MSKPKNEVVETKGGAVTEVMPDFMKEYQGQGVENLRASDAEMPRLALMQGLSDEIQSYDGVKVGDFFHTLAEKSLGKVVKCVVLHISYRYVLWNPRHAGGGILARADDGVHWNPPKGEFEVKLYKDRATMGKWSLAPTVAESGLDKWGSYDPNDPKSQPAATLCYVIVVALPEFPELGMVALMLQRTAVGAARKLIGKLKMTRAPTFGMYFQLSSFEDSRGENDFQNYRFTADGFVTDKAEFDQYQQSYDYFKKMGVNIKDIEGAQDEGIPAGGPGEAAQAAAERETKF